MKLTKEQLKQIIREELDSVMTEETIEEDWKDRSDLEHEKECRESTTNQEDYDECMRQKAGLMEGDKE